MAGESGSFWALERANRRRAALLVVTLILLLGAFGVGLDFLFHTVRLRGGRLSGVPWFTAAALVVGIAQAKRAYFGGAGMVLGALNAHPISADDPKSQVLIDVVHEMALAGRLPEPRLYIIDDPAPNAFATGRKPQDAVICVTMGLLDEMDREELQGVIGHEMAQIRSYDIRLTMLVTVILGGGGPIGLVLPPIGIFISWLIAILLSRKRDYLADAAAVEFTRNPAALIRALQHIAKTEAPLRGATPAIAQLFIVDPFESSSVSAATSYQQFIDEVTRLRSQPGKTDEQRDQEARKFAIEEYPFTAIQESRRKWFQQSMSAHPPLADRIARLQTLINTASETAAKSSELISEEMRAKRSQTTRFVENVMRTDPEATAKMMQAVVVGMAGLNQLMQEKLGSDQADQELSSGDAIAQKLYESNLRSTGDFKPNDSPLAGTFEGRLSELSADATKQLAEAIASMQAMQPSQVAQPRAVAQPHAATDSPGRSGGILLFWLVIALSAGAIIGALAIK